MLPAIKSVWLTDPAGGGMVESAGLIIVQSRNLRVVARITMPDPVLFDPGELRITQGALDALGDEIVHIFENFVRGKWGNMPREDRRANDAVVRQGAGILYDWISRDCMIVGYVGENSTLILRSEY